MHHDPQHIAGRYVAAFNETDAARRRALVEELFTPDCRYVDPLVDVAGPDGVDGFLAATQEQFAGIEFSVADTPDAHHDVVRFHWFAGPPGGTEPAVIGFDVLQLEDGRIRQVLGFIDKAPAEGSND